MYSPHLDRLALKPRAGKAWIFVLVGLVLVGGGVAVFFLLRNKDVDEFDLVPRDALGFATLRVADVLESEPGKKMMSMLEQVAGRDGMKELHAFEDQVGLKLSDVERVTIVVKEAPTNESREPVIWVLIRTKKDIDRDKVLKLIPGYEEKKHEGRTYYSFGRGGICFLSARLAAIAPVSVSGIEKCLEVAKNGPGKGALEDSIRLASGDKYHVVAAGNLTDIFKIPEVRKDLERSASRPGPEGAIVKAFLSLKSVVLTERIDKKLSIELTAEFDNADAAKLAVAAVEAGLAKARTEIPPDVRQRPEMKPLLDAMEQIKPKANGSTVTISVEMDTDPLFTAMMFWVGHGVEKKDFEGRPPRRAPEDKPFPPEK